MSTFELFRSFIKEIIFDAIFYFNHLTEHAVAPALLTSAVLNTVISLN